MAMVKYFSQRCLTLPKSEITRYFLVSVNKIFHYNPFQNPLIFKRSGV